MEFKTPRRRWEIYQFLSPRFDFQARTGAEPIDRCVLYYRLVNISGFARSVVVDVPVWQIYAELAARIGIVTPVDASEDASIWQRPSKIPPGSITMQGE